jgi:hypothetical protein
MGVLDVKRKVVAEENRLDREAITEWMLDQSKELEYAKNIWGEQSSEYKKVQKGIEDTNKNAIMARTARELGLDSELTAANQKLNADLVAGDTARIERQKALEFQRIETAQAVNNAILNIERRRIDQQLALGKISTLESINQQEAIEDVAFENALKAIKERKDAEEKAAGPGKTPATDSYQLLLREEEVLIKGFLARKVETATRTQVELKRINETEIMSRIDTARTISDSEIAIAEQNMSRLTELRLTTAAQETDFRDEQTTRRFVRDQSAMIARINLAELEANKTKAEMQAMYAELQALEDKYWMDIETSRQEGWKSVITYVQEEVDAIRDASERKMDVARDEADWLLSQGEITRNQWAAETQAALDNWYASEKANLTRLADAYFQMGAERVAEHRRTLAQLEDLEIRYNRASRERQREQEAGYRALMTQMTQSFTNGIVSWITYQKTFKDAMIASWNGIVMAFIQAVQRMVTQWIVQHVLMAALKKLFVIENTALDATQAAAHGAFTDIEVMSTYAGEGAKTAARAASVTADVAMTGVGEAAKATIGRVSVLRAAAKAAAHAFSSVMEALPFPANVIVAPIAAAGAFLGTMAVGAFEKGGVVHDDMIAQVHKNEMVLPSQISLGLQQIIKGPPGVSGGSPIIHLHSSPTFIGNEAWMKDNLRKQENEITRMIKLAMRKNALPSAPW